MNLNPFKALKKKLDEKLTIYKAMEYVISKIEVSNFDSVYTPEYSITAIDSLYSDIYAYIEILKLFINKQHMDEYIPNYLVQGSIQQVTISKWFMNNDNYVDPNEAIRQFLMIAKEYISIVDHYSNLNDIKYNQGKNLVTYKSVTSNLYTILEKLKNL